MEAVNKGRIIVAGNIAIPAICVYIWRACHDSNNLGWTTMPVVDAFDKLKKKKYVTVDEDTRVIRKKKKIANANGNYQPKGIQELEDDRRPLLPVASMQYTLGQLRKVENTPRTLQLKKAFLEAYYQCGYITEAAPAAGIERHIHYWWMDSDKEYAAKFQQLEKDVHARKMDEFEREIHRRSIEGVTEPVFGALGSDANGNSLGTGIVGKIRKYSDTLLIFKAKGEKPDKYRDTIQAPTGPGTQVVIEVVYVDSRAQVDANGQPAIPPRVQKVIPVHANGHTNGSNGKE